MKKSLARASKPQKNISARPTASPAGVRPISDDGFVSPLDLRRKAKARTLALSVVLDVVEAALSQCVRPKTPPSSHPETPDPRYFGDGAVAAAAAAATRQASVPSKGPAKGGGGAVSPPAAAAITKGQAGSLPAMARAAPSMGPAADAPLSANRWLSPVEESAASHPPWKILPTPGMAPRGGAKVGPVTRWPSPSSPSTGATVASAAAAAVAAAAAAAAVAGGRGDGVRSPSLMGSPRPHGAVVSRRREARRELAMNDADERMSCSSFDSLDVRVDDQVYCVRRMLMCVFVI